MTNYKLILQYEGTRYRGWQSQGNTSETIQGKLEAVLSRMSGEAVSVQGSGRTDAGVHALGQVANVKLSEDIEPRELKDYLNRYLPEDIAVLSAERAPERFHSRLGAVEKIYRYRIWTDGKPDVFARRYVEPVAGELQLNQMKMAAGYLTGTHDFTSFCGNKHMKKSAVRTLSYIRFQQKERELWIDYCGNGFLQNMVRILTGTLVEVGSGTRQPEEMKAVLEGRDRELAGPMMAARGLTLLEVKYQ